MAECSEKHTDKRRYIITGGLVASAVVVACLIFWGPVAFRKDAAAANHIHSQDNNVTLAIPGRNGADYTNRTSHNYYDAPPYKNRPSWGSKSLERHSVAADTAQTRSRTLSTYSPKLSGYKVSPETNTKTTTPKFKTPIKCPEASSFITPESSDVSSDSDWTLNGSSTESQEKCIETPQSTNKPQPAINTNGWYSIHNTLGKSFKNIKKQDPKSATINASGTIGRTVAREPEDLKADYMELKNKVRIMIQCYDEKLASMQSVISTLEKRFEGAMDDIRKLYEKSSELENKQSINTNANKTSDDEQKLLNLQESASAPSDYDLPGKKLAKNIKNQELIKEEDPQIILESSEYAGEDCIDLEALMAKLKGSVTVPQIACKIARKPSLPTIIEEYNEECTDSQVDCDLITFSEEESPCLVPALAVELFDPNKADGYLNYKLIDTTLKPVDNVRLVSEGNQDHNLKVYSQNYINQLVVTSKNDSINDCFYSFIIGFVAEMINNVEVANKFILLIQSASSGPGYRSLEPYISGEELSSMAHLETALPTLIENIWGLQSSKDYRPGMSIEQKISVFVAKCGWQLLSNSMTLILFVKEINYMCRQDVFTSSFIECCPRQSNAYLAAFNKQANADQPSDEEYTHLDFIFDELVPQCFEQGKDIFNDMETSKETISYLAQMLELRIRILRVSEEPANTIVEFGSIGHLAPVTTLHMLESVKHPEEGSIKTETRLYPIIKALDS